MRLRPEADPGLEDCGEAAGFGEGGCCTDEALDSGVVHSNGDVCVLGWQNADLGGSLCAPGAPATRILSQTLQDRQGRARISTSDSPAWFCSCAAAGTAASKVLTPLLPAEAQEMEAS